MKKLKKLVEVIELVAEKYLDKINLILEKDLVTLEYLTYKYGEKDDFKIIQVREFENKLSITFTPENISKIDTFEELEDIFEILDKQNHFKEHTYQEIEMIKKKYKKGTRLKINKIYDYTIEIEEGIKGTVDIVDDIGTIHIILDNEKTVALIVGLDEFEVLEKEGEH